jgi:putative ABC transport system permease protein
LVTQTVNDLFFVASVREIVVPPLTLVKGALIGVAAALLGAAFPAWEATSVPPAGALRRSNVEERMKRALPWVTGLGVALLAIGAALLLPDWNLVIAFAGLFGVIFGTALLTPLLTLALMRLASAVARPWAGVIERMAPRTITRALSRTSVAVAALMVSVSVIIGVGVMVGSFRATVVLWLQDVLQADVYVSPPSLTTTQVSTTLDPALVQQLREFPGIAQATTSRGVDVAAFLERSENVSADSGIATTVRLVAVTLDTAREERRYRSAVGDWQTTWAAVAAGGVVINEPMANRYDLGVGDMLELQTDRGRRAFPIVGISVDFDVNAVVVMHDDVYRRLWDDDAISAIALFLESGIDPDAKVAELRAALSDQGELLVRSNRGTREGALQVFDRTFAITVALQLLATIVAFIGILSTLMSLQLERAREIGVLRANGMTRGQLWRLSLLETGLMGLSAGLIALPAGYTLAAILIYVINLRSFGWTLQMQLEPGEFIQAFAVAVGAALLAGLYPAWRMGAMKPIEALRSE